MNEHRPGSHRIHEVAEKYRASGYEVVLEPTSADLPEFLSSYRPDFIARQKGETVLVEVKGRASAAEMDRYRDLAELVHSHPGWRLDLVVTNPPNSLPIESDSPVLPIWDIDRRYDEAEELLRTGHMDAAFLIAWAATEAALRIIAQSNAVEAQRSATPSLLKELATQGIISREQYDALWNSYRQRSAVAHGFTARKEHSIAQSIIDSGRALLRQISRAA